MPDFYAVQATPNIGPVYVKQERDKYAPVLSETCSRTDNVYQDKSSKQKINFQPHDHLGKDPSLVDYSRANPRSVKVIPQPHVVIKEYRGMMREHIERNVLFFFQQMIVSHKTELHFESVGAQDQGEGTDAIVMKKNGSRHKYVVRQAAHSSGNPCLVAYDNKKWQKYKEGKIPKPDGFVFLKGTDYYRTVNSTMNMPRWVNDADRFVGEMTKQSQLRERGNKLINKNAQGLITPDQGMEKYIRTALDEVNSAIHYLENNKKSKSEILEVLCYYKKYYTEIQETIENDPQFLEKFLNLKLEDGTKSQKSQRKILQMRYAAIRNCQIDQSSLIQKIENKSKKILREIKKGNNNRKPDHFLAAFRTTLIKQARTRENKQRLEKLLNFSPANYKAQLDGNAKVKYYKTRELLSAHERKINSLVREICEDMRNLRTQETYARAQIIKELRTIRGWTQRELGEAIAEIFPNAAASQSTISRIESRAKLVTEQIANEFSKVFEVDPGLLMPHFYYE